MNLWELIKNKLGFGPKMLDSGKGELTDEKSASNKKSLKSLIDARNLIDVYEQYSKLLKDVKSLDGKDDEYLSQFYDTLIEICNRGPEYSQEHLAELRNQLVQIRQDKETIKINVANRDGFYLESSAYQKKMEEEVSVVCEIEHIEDVLNDCLEQMEEEYPQNEQKYMAAKDLLLKAIESYRASRTKSSSVLAIEYAMLSKVSTTGILSSEQMKAIELAFGQQLLGKDVQTFVGERMARIESLIEHSTPTLTDIQDEKLLDDGRKFSKFEHVVNGVTDVDIRQTFESVRNQTEKSLTEDIGIESVVNLYNNVNKEFGIKEQISVENTKTEEIDLDK